MKNIDFEEINDMLGNIIGGNSGQGLFQFSCDLSSDESTKCTELCFIECNGSGSKSGTTKGVITDEQEAPDF